MPFGPAPEPDAQWQSKPAARHPSVAAVADSWQLPKALLPKALLPTEASGYFYR
jgi:hypothetical protein